MASRFPRDWSFLELDPLGEIQGCEVVRKPNRKFPEFLLSQIILLPSILTMVECYLPHCKGHRKFGTTVNENIPVIFKYHDQGKESVYVPYRNPICRPLRVPMDGDSVLSGIKWRLPMAMDPSKVSTSIFDCLIACLKDQMFSEKFCLECLFSHTNGTGLLLERVIKTILYHIVPYFRLESKSNYVLYGLKKRASDMRLKRISWSASGNFKIGCIETANGLREFVSFPGTSSPSNLQQGMLPFDFNVGVLRHLDTVSKIDVLLRCHCNGGRSFPKRVYSGLLRKVKRSETLYSITLSQWPSENGEYEDQLWNWSLFGADAPSTFVTKIQSLPINSDCKQCKQRLNTLDIIVPETTWLFMVDLSEPLQKTNVQGLRYIRDYTLGGILFRLAFVLLYSFETGHFSSLHHFYEDNKSEWRFFDDARGGLLKDCDPKRVKYSERVNLRAFYFRVTDSDPHRCLQKAMMRSAANL